MNIKPGDYIIWRTLTNEQDSQLLYNERIYIVLTFDKTQNKITAVLSVDWITGYQRDLAHDYNSLLKDGYSINILENKDVKRSGIYQKLNSAAFQIIGYEYCWLDSGSEMSACVPYTHLSYSHIEKGHRITTYADEFAAAMTVYPNGNETYIFGKRYTNFIVAPFNVEDNVYTIGNKNSNK